MAPEICFNTIRPKLELPPLDLEELITAVYQIARARQRYDDGMITILTDRKGAEIWESEFPNTQLRYLTEKEANAIPAGVYEQLKTCNA